MDARNRLDTLVYSSEKSLKDLGDKIPADDKKKVDEALVKAKEALIGKDLETIKKAEEELTTASHKIAEELYKKTASKSQGAAGDKSDGKSAPGGKDDVEDAEYKVEDDK